MVAIQLTDSAFILDGSLDARRMASFTKTGKLPEPLEAEVFFATKSDEKLACGAAGGNHQAKSGRDIEVCLEHQGGAQSHWPPLTM